LSPCFLRTLEEGLLHDNWRLPVFVPAHNRVRMVFTLHHSYPIKRKENATPEEGQKYEVNLRKYVTDELNNLDGFVLFDSSNRYDDPTPENWTKGN